MFVIPRRRGMGKSSNGDIYLKAGTHIVRVYSSLSGVCGMGMLEKQQPNGI